MMNKQALENVNMLCKKYKSIYGKEVDLTVKEFDLLVELIRNKNIAQYRDKLYEKVWDEPFMGDTRTLDTHIQRLRKKLGWEAYIKTIFRIGYRLEG